MDQNTGNSLDEAEDQPAAEQPPVRPGFLSPLPFERHGRLAGDAALISTDLDTGGHGGSGNTTTTTFLALYLILLAFFIMLNAQTEVSIDRSRAVVQSLGIVRPVVEQPLRRPMALVADELELRLADVFRRELADQESVVAVRDGAIELRLPLPRVFEPGTPVLRTFRLSLVGRLAETLQDMRTRESLHLSLTIPPGPGEAGGVPTADDLAIRRVSALARDLVRHGVDPLDFDVRVGPVGGDPGQEQMVLFRLKLQDGA